MQLKDCLCGKLILCLCEGNAEFDIVNKLLDSNMLVFSCKNLIDGKVHLRQSVSCIEDKYLSYDFEGKRVVILRIIDSKKEQFNLSRSFQGRFDIINIITSPEIETLIILDKGDYTDFLKVKSFTKPSIFCKEQYGMKNIKCKSFMEVYFHNTDQLLKAIKSYSEQAQSSNHSLYDLFNDSTKQHIDGL